MHTDRADPSASSAPSDARAYRAAERLVRAWAGWCSSGVPPHLAQRRLASVDLELWAHAAATDRGCWRLPASALVLRAAAGAPDDVRWRRSIRIGRGVHQQAPRPLVPVRHRRTMTVPLQIGPRFDQTNGVVAP